MMKIDTARLNANKSPHPSFILRETDKPHLEKILPEQRKLIELLHYEKMSYYEMRNQTGLAIGTIKSRIHRGRFHILRLRHEATKAAAAAGVPDQAVA